MHSQQVLDALDQRLRPSFRPGFLPSERVTYQLSFESEADLYLMASRESFHISDHPESPITLRIWVRDIALLEALLLGRSSGMDAFMAGDYRSDGHIVLSQLLLYLFLPVDRAFAHEVSD